MRRLLLVFRAFRCYRLLRYRSVRRFLYAQLAFFAVVTIFFFTYRGIVANRGERELRTTLAELEAKEPRWRWEHLVADRVPVPDDQNGVKVLEELDRELVGEVKEDDPTGLFRWWESEPNRLLADDRMAIVTENLTKHASALPTLRRLRDYPHGFYELPRELPHPHKVPTLRPMSSSKAAVLLDMEAERRGAIRAAPEYPRMLLNLDRYLESVPLMGPQRSRMGYITRTIDRIERMLGTGEPAELEALQADVVRAAESDRFWTGLRGERALFHEVCVSIASGDHRLSQFTSRDVYYEYYWSHHFNSLRELDLIDWMYRPRVASDHAAFLRFTGDILARQGRPDPDLWAQFQEIRMSRNYKQPSPYPSRRTVLAHSMGYLIYVEFRLHLTAKARLRCAAAGLAAERFRQGQGRWPETLDELCPKYLASVPLDPFDNQPLKYTPREDGVTIYSIGSDGKDNDGRAEVQVGYDTERDLLFRLFNPDQRGLPPLPPFVFPDFDEDGRPIEIGPMPREVPTPEDKP